MILLTNNTINKGKGIGIITAIGTLSGAFVHILLVIVGVSTIIATSPILYNGLKWGGALYLIYVGITTLISSMGKSDPTVDNHIHHTGPSKKTSIYGQAFLINVLNPKVIIFFMSFFPQFITKKAHYTLELIQLGTVFLLIGFLWMTIYTVLISTIRPLIQTPFIQKIINGTTGSLFIIIALFLLVST
ncbi:LysE family translocator [Alteribacillus sp. HJP-4]|uniref:LysE family translocator n=1 Tax=Alteribacillus sp. HJP-4 TaxID=2775394 RepID=UPI0035CCE777